jgi:hypothetical protein
MGVGIAFGGFSGGFGPGRGFVGQRGSGFHGDRWIPSRAVSEAFQGQL